MNINEILQNINLIAKKEKTKMPFLVGGVPRDWFMGKIQNVNDLDITTGDNSIYILAVATAKFFQEDLKVYPDGHSSLEIEGIKIDFSSNYVNPDAEELYQGKMAVELASRDFTCNTLLLTLNLKKIIDTLDIAIEDINNKILRTVLSPEITFVSDPKRISRVFYLSSKLGFGVDPNIISFIRSNPSLINKPGEGYAERKLEKAAEYNAENTIKLMNETGIWPYVNSSDILLSYKGKYG